MPNIPLDQTITNGQLPTTPTPLEGTDRFPVARPGGPDAGDYAATLDEIAGKIRPNIIPWDLTPQLIPVTLSIFPLPSPYNTLLANVINIVGDQYSGTYVTPPPGYTGIGALGVFATAPFTGNKCFYWKPTAGDSNNQITIMNPTSFVSSFQMYYSDGSGLHVQVGNSYSQWVDINFQQNDVALVQIAADGNISIKTANVNTGPLGVAPIASGDVLLVSCSLNGPGDQVSGCISAANDFGSGITPDNGYTSLSTNAPPGIPNTAKDGDILRASQIGTYNGVSYAVNEAALVLDAQNGVVAPMTYASIKQPKGFQIFFAQVGPNEHYQSLSNLNQDLINEGIFPKYLYINYMSNTVEDSVDLALPGIAQAILLVDSGVGSVVNMNAWMNLVGPSGGLQIEGEWHVGSVSARRVLLGISAKFYVNFFDGIDIQSAGSPEIHSSTVEFDAVRIRNLASFDSNNQNSTQRIKFYLNDGVNHGTVLISGLTREAELDLYGCSLRTSVGNHQLTAHYHFIDANFNDPQYLIEVIEGATLSVVSLTAIDEQNLGKSLNNGVAVERGIAHLPASGVNITNLCNLTANTPTIGGIAFYNLGDG